MTEEELGRSAGVEAEEAVDRSVWENLRDAIVEPEATFRDVAGRPRWLVPLAVVLVITAAVSWIMLPALLEMQRLQVLESVPPEQQQDALEQLEMFAGPLGLVFSVVSTPVMIAVVAFLFWGFGLVSGAKNARYSVAFTAMTYAGVVYVLQGVAQATVVLLKGAGQVAREGGPPLFGPSLFLDQGEMPRLLYAMLANLNFFSVWYAVVVGVAGFHALKMSRGAAIAFAVVMWLVGGVVLAFQ